MNFLKRLVRRALGQVGITHPTAAGRESDRAALLRLMPSASVCAEIGVYQGDFSEQIIDLTRPRALHLIDPWRFEASPRYERSLYGGLRGRDQANMNAIFESVGSRFAGEIAAGMVHLHRASSVSAAVGFSDAYFDWVYIDGNHLREFVKADLESYFPKVKRGGFIAGDDYGVDGWWGRGVSIAVDEFVKAGKAEVVAIMGSQYVLRKSG